MKVINATSSNVNSYLYIGDTLIVEFKGGAGYAYDKVPEDVYDKMMAAESTGKFLNKEIKGTYEFRKL